jgi:hypothetical protein
LCGAGCLSGVFAVRLSLSSAMRNARATRPMRERVHAVTPACRAQCAGCTGPWPLTSAEQPLDGRAAAQFLCKQLPRATDALLAPRVAVARHEAVRARARRSQVQLLPSRLAAMLQTGWVCGDVVSITDWLPAKACAAVWAAAKRRAPKRHMTRRRGVTLV